MVDKDFLLKAYGQCYDAEAGPWNLSKASLYLEYSVRKFFEDNFQIKENMNVCNIGIGAGNWDRYLSYHIGLKGTLTSVDIDPLCCRQLKERLENEHNPNKITIICQDATTIQNMNSMYDLVTMIGSTRLESGLYDDILSSAVNMLKDNGELYYMTLDQTETMNDFVQFAVKKQLILENYVFEYSYGFHLRYWKVIKSQSTVYV
ncbi:ubiquinone/menaquinone biosynthesis C-methylase UbiE [Paenibacillus forsythiae]|uniref:Ubiquinone/menaquinone biosynthesis C-methylase UbiE n=1 Tax=Paenibacillus forsythiae TaxID=365616 RepID=A0ABU3HEK8_9BACL|nr:class I SAM-dependent methyltransferase [Paenibacillus forsythiae]MDT3429261.1 ubiquinone/menaquinone biosynthesis C-methylase UbiE [Paenibacillus forsythiae]